MWSSMQLDADPSATEEAQKPIKQSFCRSLRRDAHWKCLILTLLIYGCLAAIVWCRLAVVTKVVPIALSNRFSSVTRLNKNRPCDDGYVYIPVAFVIMLYLVYLVECWHCHTRIELQYKVDVNTVYEKIRQMREAYPVVWWKSVCYHYVRRTRQVTRYRNGDAFTSTQVYYERINSNTAGSAFNFSQCGVKDVSGSLTDLEEYPATKVRFTKGISFANTEVECEFEDQRLHFFQENERRDDYMETREGVDLLNVNFKEYMIAFADPDNLPWYVSHIIFWVASFCLLSWPLRVIIEFKTAYVHYHVQKLFGTNYIDSSHTGGRLSRVSTMGSSDIESTIRNNYTIVPSYSEALLMDNGSSSRQLQDANGNITSPIYANGTPRSITFNTLTPTFSNGYIHGFFTGAYLSDIQRHSSCTVINGSTVIENDFAYASADRSRHRLTNSVDRHKRNEQSRPRTSDSDQNMTAITATTESVDEDNQSIQTPTHPSEDNLHSSQISENVICYSQDGATENVNDTQTVQASNSLTSVQIFNNHKVAWTSRYSEHSRTGDGLPQPPCYEDALWMQKPILIQPGANLPRVQGLEETEPLVNHNSGRQRHYHTIMETSL